MTPIRLNCLILGRDPLTNYFIVQVNLEDNIYELKKAIMAEVQLSCSAADLVLYQALVPLAENNAMVKALRRVPLPYNIILQVRGQKIQYGIVSDYWNRVIDYHLDHIQVLIQHPVIQVIHIHTLTESEFLMLRPPSLGYIDDRLRKKPKSSNTTKSSFARTPRSVVPWVGFTDDVNRMVLGNTPSYRRPTFIDYQDISDEEGVREALNHNVLKPLDTVLSSSEKFARHSFLETVVGMPDFIRIMDQILRMVIEVKTKWVLNVDDLIRAYESNLDDLQMDRTPAKGTSVVDPLKQIFGYLAYNKLQYGVLTTYDKTWFLWRPYDRPSELRISSVIRYSNKQPTLFQCFAFITSLVRVKHDCPSPPSSPTPPPPPSSEGESPPRDDDDTKDPIYGEPSGSAPKPKGNPTKRGSGAGGREGRGVKTADAHQPLTREQETMGIELFDWGSFEIFDVLGGGRSGTVFRAALRGEEVALKVCDLWQHPDYEEEILNEVKVYNALKDLQGHCVPKLKGAGYTAAGMFVIATEIVGLPLEVESLDNLDNQERLKVVEVLSRIHRHGFLHNDIRMENILVQRGGDRVKISFIDFSLSTRSHCKKEFTTEMKQLKGLLRLPIHSSGESVD